MEFLLHVDTLGFEVLQVAAVEHKPDASYVDLVKYPDQYQYIRFPTSPSIL